jgi:hypothetical protein
MELTKTNNGQWKPGQSGNLQGRPIGSRNQFSAAFMQDLAAVWAEHGRETMVATAKVSPEAFFATCARLLPRDVAISIQAQAPILDAGDLAILRAIREASGDRQLAGQHSVALSRSIGRRFCGRYSGWASAFTIAVIVIVLGIVFLVYYLK